MRQTRSLLPEGKRQHAATISRSPIPIGFGAILRDASQCASCSQGGKRMISKLSRRGFLGCACCAPLAASMTLGAGAFAPAHAAGKKTDLTPDQALELLKEGNRKFVADVPAQPPMSRERRLEIAAGQTPFAVLVSCSDSRVPPELLFGRGLGELF